MAVCFSNLLLLPQKHLRASAHGRDGTDLLARLPHTDPYVRLTVSPPPDMTSPFPPPLPVKGSSTGSAHPPNHPRCPLQ